MRNTWIADRSLAAKMADGRRSSESSARAGAAAVSSVKPPTWTSCESNSMPASRERGAVPGFAPAGRLEIGATGEEPDPAMAELDEVAGGADRALVVLRVDRGQA